MKTLLLFSFLSVFMSGCMLEVNPMGVECVDGVGCFDSESMVGRVYVYDKEGRIVTYHGVNMSNSSKYDPQFHHWQTKEDIRVMKQDWGLNAVRLLLFWNAIEPQEKQFDTAYLDYIKQVISWCEEYDIAVLIDYHKDVFGESFESAGFPKWITETDGIPFNKNYEEWAKNFESPAVVRAFYNFWTKPESQAKYLRMLRYSLKYIMASKPKNVIGVDIMNEPFPHNLDFPVDDYVETAKKLMTDVNNVMDFEQKFLTPLYNESSKVLEEVDPNLRMFFEPWISTSTGLKSTLTYRKRQGKDVYIPHFYQYLVYGGKTYDGTLDKSYIRMAMDQRDREAKDWGYPLMFGEFGADCDRGADIIDYLNEVVDSMEQVGAGWFYYTYDKRSGSGFAVLNDDGTPRTVLTDVLIRVYAPKIAGKYPVQKRAPGEYALYYKNSGIKAATELFIPKNLQNVRVMRNGVLVSTATGDVKVKNDGKDYQQIKVSWDL